MVDFLAFEDEGEALAHADAEGGNSNSGALAGELVGNGSGEPGTGGAEGVAEGDGAALRVEDRGVELGPLGEAAEYLRGEGLVELQYRQVVKSLARLGQSAVHGLDGGESEVLRVGRGHARRGHPGEGFASGGPKPLRVGQQQGGGPVVQG